MTRLIGTFYLHVLYMYCSRMIVVERATLLLGGREEEGRARVREFIMFNYVFSLFI